MKSLTEKLNAYRVKGKVKPDKRASLKKVLKERADARKKI